MQKLLNEFCRAILAGVMISIGCIVFLMVDNRIAGAVLFSTGLLTILYFKLNLFTGKAPYICQNNFKYSALVGIIWLGNFVGTIITVFLIKHTSIYHKIIDRCYVVAEAKVSATASSLFILSIFCGILMFIAVEAYRRQDNNKNYFAVLLVIFCVSVFILAGFEHSIANMFYFMLALPVKQWILPLIIITFGNLVGGNIFCYGINKIKEA